MESRDHFELRRLSDSLVYQFDRTPLPNGQTGYKRRDQDLWITFKADLGWVAYDEELQSVMGRPWNILVQNQTDSPPEGEWVSKKGDRSYVYNLVYCAPKTEI
jgi:hypothetical protein